jgi:hypothetical protein
MLQVTGQDVIRYPYIFHDMLVSPHSDPIYRNRYIREHIRE